MAIVLNAKMLPAVLSVIAGSVDAISFLGLGGLFTAHVTGNLVVLVAHLATGSRAPCLRKPDRQWPSVAIVSRNVCQRDFMLQARWLITRWLLAASFAGMDLH